MTNDTLSCYTGAVFSAASRYLVHRCVFLEAARQKDDWKKVISGCSVAVDERFSCSSSARMITVITADVVAQRLSVDGPSKPTSCRQYGLAGYPTKHQL